MNPIAEEPKFGPNEAQNRHFQEEGFWVLLSVGVDKFYAKITEPELNKALSGQWFEAHHLVAPNGSGQRMLLAPIMGTLDPEYFNGAAVHAITRLHPKIGNGLDENIKKKFSPIVAAKATDIPATGKLILG